MDTIKLKPALNKNATGLLGPICNNCAGYGFTLGISGTDNGCHYCNQTGVSQPTTSSIEDRVASLELEIRGLKNIILKELGKKV